MDACVSASSTPMCLLSLPMGLTRATLCRDLGPQLASGLGTYRGTCT